MTTAMAREQPFLFGSGWIAVKDGNPTARAIFDRHYSRKRYADGRKPDLFVGPLTADVRALFVWRNFISGDGQEGINCAIFRNEGDRLSSDLVREADDIAFARWPGERHYTYVNARAIRSDNPGHCFKEAGWRRCGETKWNRLTILEMRPEWPRYGRRALRAAPWMAER